MNEVLLKKIEAVEKELIEKGKPKGMITEKEIEDAFAELEIDPEKIEQMPALKKTYLYDIATKKGQTVELRMKK